jgi:putative transposase
VEHPSDGPQRRLVLRFRRGKDRGRAAPADPQCRRRVHQAQVGCRIDRSIGARDIADELAELFERHGRPRILRSDNGREVIAESLADWLRGQGVGQLFIEKASPQQNAYVERFNGTMRDEVLNGETFRSVLEARVVIGQWIETCNTIRPHRGLGYKTPAAFYEIVKAGSR